jgi:tetratricopeptide (TPR) repeat protein
LRGDRAVILAQAGRRDEAVALVAQNLERAEDAALAEAKAGDAYRALGESDAAEAYYRRSLAEAKTAFERSEAVLRIVSLLSDAGREQDAARFLAEERKRPGGP